MTRCVLRTGRDYRVETRDATVNCPARSRCSHTDRPDSHQDPPRPANQNSVCISYAWKEEFSKDPDRAGKVDLFCTKLRQTGRSIFRDNTHLVFGDRLSTFMRQIGHGDRIYIFLSDAYLKSPNCMYELHTIWQTSGDDEEQFRQRTRVFTIPGTEIFSIPARLKYAAHSKKQLVETQQIINENGVDVLGPT